MHTLLNKFNQTIKVEVEVDYIASKLLSMFFIEEKHAPLVVDAIMSRALNDSTLMNNIYSSIHGHTNEVDFEVGDTVMCTSRYLFTDGHKEIGRCKVERINSWDKENLTVSFNDGDRKITKTVSHLNCSKIPVPLH